MTEDGRNVSLTGGVVMPLVGFGTWQLTGRRGYQALRQAIAAGYRHLDTATMYGNEDEVGRAIRDSGVPRGHVFVTTKLPPNRAGHARETLAASLRALGTEYVDLWLIHWPPTGRASRQAWSDLLAARDAGHARAVGVSNYDLDQIDDLITETGQAPQVNQIPWSPTLYDADLLAQSRARGVVVEGYSPFRRTDLRDSVLAEVAKAHGVTPAQVVLRWHVEHRVVVIPKSATPQRIASNLDVFGFALSDAEMARIDGLAG
jgi:diketogulonate reductase-like aldo/keto reductase